MPIAFHCLDYRMPRHARRLAIYRRQPAGRDKNVAPKWLPIISLLL